DFLKDNGARVMSLLTSCEPPEVGTRSVYIRIRDMDKTTLKRLREDLEKNFELEHWVVESVHPVA
ncbi:MAG: hypothetical protein PHV85_02875, partial [Desulfovibrionaceae bacterium]|nr:hypothetical protein [Desulfovibrionaceae bacterium]